MARKKYIALHTVDYVNEDGQRVYAPAFQKGKSTGLFSAEYDAKVEKRLLDAGAVRLATKADLAGDDVADLIEGEAPPVLEAIKAEDGKWAVARDGVVVSGDEKFDTKKAAEAWATANPDAVAAPAADLL